MTRVCARQTNPAVHVRVASTSEHYSGRSSSLNPRASRCGKGALREHGRPCAHLRGLTLSTSSALRRRAPHPWPSPKTRWRRRRSSRLGKPPSLLSSWIDFRIATCHRCARVETSARATHERQMISSNTPVSCGSRCAGGRREKTYVGSTPSSHIDA